jgi:two-component system, NarL family, invasion response regulator UvrY
LSPLSLLLVDDNAAFLAAETRFLRSHGGDGLTILGTARDGDEALTQARALQPEIILLDLMMPGRGALETITRLRQVVPEPGVIVLSLLDALPYRQAALAAGADAFLSKGELDRELVRTIRHVAEARRRRMPVPAED